MPAVVHLVPATADPADPPAVLHLLVPALEPRPRDPDLRRHPGSGVVRPRGLRRGLVHLPRPGQARVKGRGYCPPLERGLPPAAVPGGPAHHGLRGDGAGPLPRVRPGPGAAGRGRGDDAGTCPAVLRLPRPGHRLPLPRGTRVVGGPSQPRSAAGLFHRTRGRPEIRPGPALGRPGRRRRAGPAGRHGLRLRRRQAHGAAGPGHVRPHLPGSDRRLQGGGRGLDG